MSYFAGFKARGADILALSTSANEGLDALDIRIPAATCLYLRVGNVISEAGPFATDIAC